MCRHDAQLTHLVNVGGVGRAVLQEQNLISTAFFHPGTEALGQRQNRI